MFNTLTLSGIYARPLVYQLIDRRLFSSLNTPKPSLWTRIKTELEHYKQGSIKFGQETKTSFRILLRLYKTGKIDLLTRRERMQLARTGADMVRLVPFSIFVVVPFLEFLLPVFIKIFPNMLPSTFENAETRKSKLMATSRSRKAAHDALHLILLEVSTGDKNVFFPGKLSEILQESHISTTSLSIKEKLEELKSLIKSNEISSHGVTPQTISAQHLHAICSLLGLSKASIPPAKIVNSRLVFIGSDALKRYQLRNHLKRLKNDDRLILDEGVDSLLPAELIQACHMRGIPTVNLNSSKSEEEYLETLRADLQQWLDLTTLYGFPMLLVILTNALIRK